MRLEGSAADLVASCPSFEAPLRSAPQDEAELTEMRISTAQILQRANELDVILVPGCERILSTKDEGFKDPLSGTLKLVSA